MGGELHIAQAFSALLSSFPQKARSISVPLVLAGLLSTIEPLKLLAVFLGGEGHFIAGIFVMICAYAANLFVTERLFVIVKPNLPQLAEVRFRPTKSSFTYYRLAYFHDVATVGAVSMDPTVRHGTAGGLGDYSAHSHEVYEMARRAALKHAGC